MLFKWIHIYEAVLSMISEKAISIHMIIAFKPAVSASTQSTLNPYDLGFNYV
ncbi:MAG: hypothetical protein QW101_01140 [Ignisphaera sp.]